MNNHDDSRFNILNKNFNEVINDTKTNKESKVEEEVEEYYYIMKYSVTFSRPISISKYYEDVLNNITFIIEEARMDGYTFHNDKDIYVALSQITEEKMRDFNKHVIFPQYREPWKADFHPCLAEKVYLKKKNY